MDTSKYEDGISELPMWGICDNCNRPLAPAEDETCAECIEGLHNMTWDDEPSDEQKMRAWDLSSRFWAGDWSVIGFSLLVLVLAGLGMVASDARAQSPDTLIYTSPGGHTLELPYIGTPAYSASCEIVQAWEDHSAVAFCTEDGAMYAYDPDGSIDRAPNTWYAIETTR